MVDTKNFTVFYQCITCSCRSGVVFGIVTVHAEVTGCKEKSRRIQNFMFLGFRHFLVSIS